MVIILKLFLRFTGEIVYMNQIIIRFFAYILFFYSLSLSSMFAFLDFGDNHIAHVVIDYNSGEIISSYREQERMYPASLTKMMTLYLLFDKLANNEITFNSMLKISKVAAGMPPSKLGIPAGSSISVRDAILSVIVRSNNDIAYAIAENIAGTEAEFVTMMNEKAQELGMQNTVFRNSNGLHNKEQYTTALDMAKLSRALMIHHNAYYPLFSIPSFRWNRINYLSTNHLLANNAVDGIKTGYTSASGFNLISSAQVNNVRVVAVVLGFYSPKNRDEYMGNLIDLGLDIAKKNRMMSVSYFEKPKQDSTENLTIEHDSELEDYDEIISSTETTKEPSVSTKDIYNIDYQDDQNTNHYSIERIPYLDKITEAEHVYISPNVKNYPVKRSIKNKKSRYTVQVGAFSSYSSALNASFNVTKYKAVTGLISKQDIEIKQNNKYYMARFKNLTKTEATKTCKILQQKGQDCFVLA